MLGDYIFWGSVTRPCFSPSATLTSRICFSTFSKAFKCHSHSGPLNNVGPNGTGPLPRRFFNKNTVGPHCPWLPPSAASTNWIETEFSVRSWEFANVDMRWSRPCKGWSGHRFGYLWGSWNQFPTLSEERLQSSFEGSQKLYLDFKVHRVRAPNPTLFKVHLWLELHQIADLWMNRSQQTSALSLVPPKKKSLLAR